MFTRTNSTEKAFSEWIDLLGQTDQLSESTKDELIAYLIKHRHVMVIDIRQFFPDAMKANKDLDTDYPFAILSRALPLIVINTYPSISEAVKFCKLAGLTYEFHCYNDRFFKETKQ